VGAYASRAAQPSPDPRFKNRNQWSRYLAQQSAVLWTAQGRTGALLPQLPAGLAFSATRGPGLTVVQTPTRSTAMGSLFTTGGASIGTGGGSGFDWGGLISGIGGIAGSIMSANAQTKQLNAMRKLLQLGAGGGVGNALSFSGAPAVPAAGGAVPGTLAAILGGAGLGFGLPSLGGLTDVLPGGLEEGGTGLFGLDMFKATAASARQRMLDAVHPTTGVVRPCLVK